MESPVGWAVGSSLVPVRRALGPVAVSVLGVVAEVGAAVLAVTAIPSSVRPPSSDTLGERQAARGASVGGVGVGGGDDGEGSSVVPASMMRRLVAVAHRPHLRSPLG